MICEPHPFFYYLAIVALPLMEPAQGSARYEWTFDTGSLATSLGNGTMSYADSITPVLTQFAVTNGTTVPHIKGRTAAYMAVPALVSSNSGYLLSFLASGPNGGGTRLNRYSLIMDVYSPGAPGWQAIVNYNANNNDDADWYIDNDGATGIGALFYSAKGVFLQNTWHRIAMTADTGNGITNFYVDGKVVFHSTSQSSHDGRFTPGSNATPGDDLRLFSEGDTSGIYTHAFYVNSVAFTDDRLDDATIAAMGGADAAGIFTATMPRITSLAYNPASDRVQLCGYCQRDLTYQWQVSPSLGIGSWSFFANAVPNVDGLITLDQATGSHAPRLFFRLVSP